MSEKPDGVDFDRQAFVRRQEASGPKVRIIEVVLVLALIAAMALGIKLLPLFLHGAATSSDPDLAQIDKRLSEIEGRLQRLEAARRATVPVLQGRPPEPNEAPSKPAVKTIYQVSPLQPPSADSSTPASTPSDPAVAQRLSALRQDLGGLESNEDANREAWQATSDKLADMAGQVGVQGGQIIRNQDELDDLLARTQMETIPFELLRGSNPQPVGPVALRLESSNPKSQRYTLCVYVQPSCIELKDRTLHEVVQFALSRDSGTLEVIATKITKDQLLGYLEVPRIQNGHLSPH